MKTNGTKINTINNFQKLNIETSKNEVFSLFPIYFHDGVSDPIGETTMNDTSIVFKINYGNNHILITGDIGIKASEYLVNKKRNELEDINILQVPHHAATPTAIDEFFFTTHPDVALVPAFKDLWLNNDRTKNVHKILDDINSQIYVSALDGNIYISLFPTKYTIQRQNDILIVKIIYVIRIATLRYIKY